MVVASHLEELSRSGGVEWCWPECDAHPPRDHRAAGGSLVQFVQWTSLIRVVNFLMDAATQSMIDNLKKNTGRSLEAWFTVLEAAGLEKHTELMNVLKRDYGVTHGFANGIVLQYRNRGTAQDDSSLVDGQYAGPKADLRPLYDSLVASVSQFGDDVEIAPKKTSVSLRRSKQFALIEAASAKRLQLGINLKGTPPTDRLLEAGGMCTHKVSVSSAAEIDDELIGWLRDAYERA